MIGHSERRQTFGETDILIASKMQRALKYGMRVILCIGETTEEREEGWTNDVLLNQLEAIKS